MQPTSDSDLLAYVVAAAVFAVPAIYWVKVTRRRTDLIRFRLRRLSVAAILYGVGVFLLIDHGYKTVEAVAFSFFFALAGAFLLVRPSSNRRISASVRRAVIARDLSGKPFDSSIHEIDHIVPFSAGGDNSERNLRVILKTDNRRKGRRMPNLKEMM